MRRRNCQAQYVCGKGEPRMTLAYAMVLSEDPAPGGPIRNWYRACEACAREAFLNFDLVVPLRYILAPLEPK